MVATLTKPPTVGEYEGVKPPTIAEYESPEPQRISVWEPTLKERVRNVISGMAQRSPFVQQGKRLGQLGLHHFMESVSGLGLFIPDIVASKITKEDTLASAIDKITGFEPTPRDVGAGEAAKFITSLHTVGKILGPAIAKIPAREVLRLPLGGGLQFGTRGIIEETSEYLTTAKHVDWKKIHAEAGFGTIFGITEATLGKIAGNLEYKRFIKTHPAYKIMPRRYFVKMREAMRAAKGGMGRNQWRKLYGKDVQGFLDTYKKIHYPIRPELKGETPPTRAIPAPERAIQPRKPKIRARPPKVAEYEAKPEMPKGIKKGDTFREASQDWKVIGLGQTSGGDIGILGETERGQRVIFDPEFIQQKLAKPEAVEVAPAKVEKIRESRKQIEQLTEKGELEGLWQLQDKIAQQKYEYNKSKAGDATSIRLDEPSGRYVIISPSAKQKGKWQLTKFDEGGPFEDTTSDTKEEALELISGKRTAGLDWSDGDDYLVTEITLAQPPTVAKKIDLTKLPKGTKLTTTQQAAEKKREGAPFSMDRPATEFDVVTLPKTPTTTERKYLQSIGWQQYSKEPKRWFGPRRSVTKAEPTKVVGKKFVREARAEAIITKAEMGIVEIEPGTGVPYWHKAATQGQKDRILELAQKKAMVGEKGKLKPQFRKIAGIYTGEKYIERLTKDEADTLINTLLKLPEPKMQKGKLVPPSIPRTTALAKKGFFQRRFKRPTPFGLITSNSYYAEKLGVHSLVEPLEKAKMRFDLEHQKASNELDRMGQLIDKIGKTTARERLGALKKNIPTRARTEMGNLLDSYEEAPANLSPEKKEIFNWFRNLTKTMLARQNEAREKLGWPPIQNRKAYMRHIATDVSRDMLAGKYPFPEGIGFWSGLNVGKKVFNPMEFQRRLEDDVHGLFSTDPVYASKAMMHNALKEIHLNQPLKFFNEQLNALGKDLPEYRNLSPRERAELDRTMVIPADTRRWLIDYVNNVIKGQQTMPDRLVNNIVNESGLKGLLNTALRPYGRVLSQRPVTKFFQTAGRSQMAGVMGPRPRLLIRNKFQLTQNMALYGLKANIRAFLPPNKELKELLDKSLFLKSYTGLEELPIDLAKKIEKLWHKAYQWTATSNARQSMEVAYWDIKELIDNPKYKKYGWKPEHLLKEMEFGASATQYQYNAIGMPGIFRHKSLIPATRLTSWWMNYFAKFHREAIHRAFTGRPSWSGPDGPTLPWSRRLGWLRYAIIGGLILNTMGYTRSYMFGAAPTGWPPALQAVDGLYKYVIADDEQRRKAAKTKFYNAAKTFIPGYIAYKDFDAIWTGRKDLKSLLFYEKRKKKKVDE